MLQTPVGLLEGNVTLHCKPIDFEPTKKSIAQSSTPQLMASSKRLIVCLQAFSFQISSLRFKSADPQGLLDRLVV